MIISTLRDDKKKEGSPLINEHGLSFHIHKEEYNILFDMGASESFAYNAQKMGIDLNNIDLAVISHGHYDHGGGLKTFFKENKNSEVYLKPLGKYYRLNDPLSPQEINLDIDVLEKNSLRLKYIRENREVLPGIHLISSIIQKYDSRQDNNGLYKMKNGKMVRDDFDHELLMILEEKDKIIIISGCSHQGILNMIETACNLFPQKHIKAIIGGFHLIYPTEFSQKKDYSTHIKKIGEKIAEYPVEMIYTGHCTSEKSYNILKEVLKDRLNYAYTGTVIYL